MFGGFDCATEICNLGYGVYGWGAGDASVASVDQAGFSQGIAPGSTNIFGFLDVPSYTWKCPYRQRQIDTGGSIKPAISGPNTVWWFNGQTPTGYATSITLTSSGGPSTTWSVTTGSTKVNLSATSGSSINVTSSGTAFSGGNGNDISLVASTNGVSSNAFTLTIRTPKELVSPQQPIDYSTNDCVGTSGSNGFFTYYFYTVLDQLGGAISSVGINEAFQLGKLNINPNNWDKPSPQGGMSDVNGGFIDGMCVYSVGLYSPQPLVPQSPLSTYGIDAFNQYWCVGTSSTSLSTVCTGVQVQTDTFSRWLDHARPVNPTSP